MRPNHVATAGFMLLSQAHAHYFFGRFIFEGRWTDTWEYVREISEKDYSQEFPGKGPFPEALFAPNTDPDSVDLRCGRNASTAWNKVKVATVTAGDTVGFAVGKPAVPNEAPANRPSIYHPGFASAWLSKAPNDDLMSYKGDGDWVKILSVTKREKQSFNCADTTLPNYCSDKLKSIWGTFRADSWNFTIPRSTPPGHYLVRFEHIFPNEYEAQWYPNCAHVHILPSGDQIATPSPMVKIPGAYQRGQKDVYFYPYDLNFNIDKFVAPAPQVWTG